MSITDITSQATVEREFGMTFWSFDGYCVSSTDHPDAIYTLADHLARCHDVPREAIERTITESLHGINGAKA